MPPLPPPPPEIPRITALDALAPRFRAAIEAVLDRLRVSTYDPIVAESIRTHERQAFLYGFGRGYDDGRGVVTNSRDADETWHHFGLAVDVWSRSRLWNAPAEFWAMLGKEAKAQGLAWGGDWSRFPDRPHVQWGPPMRRSPSPRAARLLAEGGVEAVWREVGAVDA